MVYLAKRLEMTAKNLILIVFLSKIRIFAAFFHFIQLIKNFTKF